MVGSSIIKRATVAARLRTGGLNLNLHDTSIWWQGYGGMNLLDLVPKLKTLKKVNYESPDFLVVHCGANDIGRTPLLSLIKLLQSTVLEIQQLFPDVRLVWSSLLPRFNWRYSNNIQAMESARTRINREAIKFITSRGGAFIKHPQLEAKPVHLYHSDGVHLSQLGNEIFLNNLQGAIEGFQSSQANTGP
jgi:lysophospholipase L1-like esterase